MRSSVAVFAEHKRRRVVAELVEMVEHKSDIRAAAAMAASARLADPSAPDLLQRVPPKHAAAVAALLATGPRLRCMLKAATSSDGNVRAVRRGANAGGSSHVYIFGG
jgi:hypothetical protein